MSSIQRILHIAFISVLLTRPLPVFAGDDIVHAVIFYSPSCPHCAQVINEDLPPLLEEYGEQFSVIAVNTAHPDGQASIRQPSSVSIFSRSSGASPRSSLGTTSSWAPWRFPSNCRS